jgi:hypothetical protein
MPLTTQFSLDYPGVQVLEQTFGAVASPLGVINRTVAIVYGDATATNRLVDVRNLEEATAALAGTNSSYVMDSYIEAAIRAYFRNSPRVLTLLVAADLEDAEAQLEQMVEDGSYRLAILTAPQAEVTLADRNDLYDAITDIAEQNYQHAYITLKGEDATAILADKTSLAVTSATGHVSAFAVKNESLVNSSGQEIDPALLAAAITMRRVFNDGYRQPGAGLSVPIRGVANGESFTKSERSDLQSGQVNPISRINAGWYVYGYQTLSTLPAYRQGTVRNIFNVIGDVIERTSQQFVFQSIDGEGVLFSDVRRVFNGVLFGIYSTGALFGGTPDDAYLVICDERNNTPETLEAGELRADIYAKPSPFAEFVLVSVQRVSLSVDIPSEVA